MPGTVSPAACEWWIGAVLAGSAGSVSFLTANAPSKQFHGGSLKRANRRSSGCGTRLPRHVWSPGHHSVRRRAPGPSRHRDPHQNTRNWAVRTGRSMVESAGFDPVTVSWVPIAGEHRLIGAVLRVVAGGDLDDIVIGRKPVGTASD